MDRRVAPTIALIDDDFAVRDSLTALLNLNGYAVLAFESAAEFFKSELAEGCACLVVDVELPKESGFEVVSRLRRQGCSTPAIFISGRTTSAMRGRAKAAHADLLEKPMLTGVLLAKIGKLLGRQ